MTLGEYIENLKSNYPMDAEVQIDDSDSDVHTNNDEEIRYHWETVTIFTGKKTLQECKHSKVYANYILASNLPQQPWICALCGKEGVDCGATMNDEPKFDEVKAMFQNK